MKVETLHELRVVVERAVRPLRASLARKRKIREELLAHLTSIFDEEIARLGDERAAADQAKRRFGDAAELSPQIDASIPKSDRIGAFMERIALYRKGESPFAHGARIAFWAAGYFAVMNLTLPPLLWQQGREREIGIMEVTLLTAGLCLGSIAFAMTLLGHGVRNTLFPAVGVRSFWRGSACLLASSIVVPISGFFVIWAAAGDLLQAYVFSRSLWWCIFAVPLVLTTVVWLCAQEAKADAEWAGLAIDESNV
jgi:ATP-dependent Clp protease ATP-binding subunit ClpC